MTYWNNALYFDVWWRKKYNVSWGSKEHKEVSFQVQLWEYLEQQIIDKAIDDYDPEAENEMIEEISGNSSKRKIVSLTQKEIEAEFDNINLDDFK